MYEDLQAKHLRDDQGHDIKDLPRWRIASEMEDLSRTFVQDNLTSWFRLGLEKVLGWQGQWSSFVARGKSFDDFRATVAADLAEDDAWASEDETYDGWADSDKKIIEAWLALTPFDIYLMVRDFRQAMLDRVADEFQSILTGSATKEQDYAEKVWSRITDGWLQSKDLA